MIKIRYVRKINRKTDYYDVGKTWFLSINRHRYYKISWSKWLFKKRIIIYILK